MDENDKEIENLIERMMTDTNLESPSFDFTSQIMSQVLVTEKNKINAYSPLISKTTWVFLGISLIVLTAYSIFINNDMSNFEITKTYSDKASNLFLEINFPKNILYPLLIVPFMILIQIGILKNYFDKKYEL